MNRVPWDKGIGYKNEVRPCIVCGKERRGYVSVGVICRVCYLRRGAMNRLIRENKLALATIRRLIKDVREKQNV